MEFLTFLSNKDQKMMKKSLSATHLWESPVEGDERQTQGEEPGSVSFGFPCSSHLLLSGVPSAQERKSTEAAALFGCTQ